MSAYQLTTMNYVLRIEKYRDKELKNFFIKNGHKWINLFGYYIYLYKLKDGFEQERTILQDGNSLGGGVSEGKQRAEAI